MERNRQHGPAPEWVEVALRAVGEAVAARDAAWHTCARMQTLIDKIEAEQERAAAFDADETALSEAEAARFAEDMAVEADERTRLPLS